MIHVTAQRVGQDSKAWSDVPFSWLVAWLDDPGWELTPYPLDKMYEGQVALKVVRWSPRWAASIHDYFGLQATRKEEE
jgi:hypothetical protein